MRGEHLWFAHSDGDGFDHFATEAAAVAHAEKMLQDRQDDAPSDGWAEDVESICYGRILGRCEKTGERPKLDGESHDGDETWSYDLTRPEQDELARLREYRASVDLWLEGDREMDLDKVLAWWNKRERICSAGKGPRGERR